MTLDTYVAVVDTSILALLIAWAWLDRHNIYFTKDK